MLDSTAEMCADWYAKDYYAASPRNDPQGPSSGTHRVLRGGASGEPGFARRIPPFVIGYLPKPVSASWGFAF